MPVVVMSAHGLAMERDSCLEAGCNAFVGKPIRPEQLVQLLKKQMTD